MLSTTDLCDNHVDVLQIATPGLTNYGGKRSFAGSISTVKVLEMAKSLGISRFGQPEEIANVVAFLLSSHSSYMQGAIVDVDGGQIRTL